MKVLKVCYVVLAAACAVSLATLALCAEEPKKDQEPAAASEQPKAAPKDPVAEWKELDARIVEMRPIFAKYRKEFDALSADDPRKAEIKRDFDTLFAEYNTKIAPRKFEIAPEVYAADASNLEAGRFTMQLTLSKNRYADALAIADKLSAAGDKSPPVAMIPAVANFAMHDFEKSKAILEQAQKDGLLNEQGQQLLKDSGEYIELWKKEQALRAAEESAPPEKQNPRVELKTGSGKLVIELFEDQAPNTVANFISLIESKAYDGTKFHRVIPNFMIQGGDPNSKDDDPSDDGHGGPGYNIDCECARDDTRQHFRGSLSMAHAGKNTGGSQFFVTHQPTPHLNGRHTVFGRVIEGQELVDAVAQGDKIESAVVVRKREHEYKPETRAKAEPGSEKKSEK